MEKRKYLEGLRGILALVVVLHHFILLFVPALAGHTQNSLRMTPQLREALSFTPLNLCWNGGWAVSMFFLLSGFVLTLKYRDTNDITLLQHGALKRYFRLLPPILGSVLLIFLVSKLGLFDAVNYPRQHPDFAFGKSLFANPLPFSEFILQAFVEVPILGNTSMNPVLWTMGVELWGALLMFCLLLVTHDSKYRMLFFGITLLVLSYLNKYFLLLFVAGSFVALREQGIKELLRNRLVKLLLLATGIYLASIPNLSNAFRSNTIYAFSTGLANESLLLVRITGCVLLLLVALSSSSIQKIFSVRALFYLGKISFSMYLLHLPVLFLSGTVILTSLKGDVHPVVLFILVMVPILVCSHLFTRWVDQPGIRFSNILFRKSGTLFSNLKQGFISDGSRLQLVKRFWPGAR